MTDRIDNLDVGVYVIPTSSPESDGTFEWDKTTMVTVHVGCRGVKGFGYTYADRATGVFITEHLRDRVLGLDPMKPEHAWASMRYAIRNVGRPGVASMAIAAVDTAIWDLKARLQDIALVTVLGARRASVPLYGSGGFTSYSENELMRQLCDWVLEGIRMVKMKVGRDPQADVQRVRVARMAIGADVELFVDANGAHDATTAITQGERFAEYGVSWFEEPVSSDDLRGLAYVREKLESRMDIAAGEYGYDLPYFERMLDARAITVLQADVTRCAGITELLRVDALCDAHNVPLSLHTAPALHLHVACACGRVRHLEYFHDHVRIERMLLDGMPEVIDGALAPQTDALGNGLMFRHDRAAPYAR